MRTPVILSLSLVLTTPALAQSTDGQIAHWAGDGDAFDTYGGFEGSLIGNTTFTAGVFDDAFDFDGSGDYVSVPSDPALEPEALTISAWIHADATSRFTGIAGKIGGSDPANRAGYLLSLDGLGRVRCDVIRDRFVFPEIQGTAWGAANLRDGAWHHVACTYDGATIAVFVDGVEAGTAAYTQGYLGGSQPLRIGIDPYLNENRAFAGAIDDVRLFGRALPECEVSTLVTWSGTGDADSDDIIDACDACANDPDDDGDNDGVCGDVDNCPTTSNANQADQDGDEIGDACDDDIDGDGVSNATDNCPFDANSDQADADDDGAGDACDTDTDGDGIDDSDDACLDSEDGAPTDATGCTVTQICPCDGDWKNHGAYVSCVARTSAAFVRDGLMDGDDQGATVSSAARSSCGK